MRWSEQLPAQLHDLGAVTVRTQLPQLVEQIDDDRRRAAVVIPLVMVQVAIFGLVVLALATSALIDQRRQELALARLRGLSSRRSGRELVTELWLLVTIGTVSGLGLAFAVTAIVRHTWLAGTTPAEFTWSAAAANAIALLAGLATVPLTLRAVARQSIATLLRTVPARRRSGLITPASTVLISLAVSGLVATVSGGDRGPLAIVTPALLALAAGLVFAAVLVAVAAPLGAWALRRGRLSSGLAALQVARRRAPSQLVPVVAVATALVAFAGQAVAIADRNRDTRAGLETGAQTVLNVDTYRVRDALAVLNSVDPDRRWSTAVVLNSPPSPHGLRLMGIEPDSFRRVAIGGDTLADAPTYDRLSASRVEPVTVRGGRLVATVAPLTARIGPPTPPAAGQELQPVPTRLVTLAATYVNALRVRSTTTIGVVPLNGKRSVTLSAPVNCLQGCQLLRLHIGRETGSTRQIQGALTITSLHTDTDPRPVDLGGTTDWADATPTKLDGESVSLTSGGSDDARLTVDFSSLGTNLAVQHRWFPPRLPVVTSPDGAATGGTTAPALDGQPVAIESAGTATGPVPRHLNRVAVADLESLVRWGGPEPIGSTSIQVWLSRDGTTHSDDLVAAFAKARIPIKNQELLSDRTDRYARTASALALRLTPVLGGAALALALAVLLLLALSTRRARTDDHASLRLAGVAASTTSRSTQVEQFGLAGVATVLGSVCGVIGGQLALPLIPLFDTEQPAVPVDLGVSWSAAALSLLVTAAVLGAGVAILTRALTRRPTPLWTG